VQSFLSLTVALVNQGTELALPGSRKLVWSLSNHSCACALAWYVDFLLNWEPVFIVDPHVLCDKQEAEASTSKLWSEQVDEGTSEH
jgi:hypothetical protein